MKNIIEEIPLFKVHMSPTAKDAVANVLDSGYIGQGPKVEEFESDLRNYLNVDRLVTLNSGTSGLHLAIHLLKDRHISYNTNGLMNKNYEKYWPGMFRDDEILATPLTCTATNWPILANNFKIKWVDVDPKTLNMDLDDLERKLSPKTKAIMVVHWGGYPVDLDRLKRIQQKAYSLFGFKPAIIEDAAHAFGSEYKGNRLGSHGNMVMYSLQAIKHVTSIDGGVLVLPHQELFTRAKLLRWYGIDRDANRKDFRCEANIDEWGFKFHMNDVCAAVGIENLKCADNIIQAHRNNANYYDANLNKEPGIQLLERHPDHNSSFWIYSMLIENRDGFYKWMKECGIVVSQVHERNDKHVCVDSYKAALPTLDSIIGKVVSIPVGWWVSDEQREYIVDCIKRGW